MGDSERIRLPNHQAVSGAPIGGWRALVFGLPFAGAWLLLLLGRGAIRPARGVPPVLIDIVAWGFGLAGLYFVLLGLLGIRRRTRRRALRQTRPDEPWLADHDWDFQGGRDDTWRRVRRAAFGMVFFAVLFAPLAWWAFLSGDNSFLIRAMTVVFGLVFAYAFYHSILLTARALRFGASRIHFASFPFFLGEELRCTLELNADLRSMECLDLTLRCVEERYEISGPKNDRSSRVVCFQIYAERRRFQSPGELATVGDAVTLGFDLPHDGEPTRLTDRPALFWELDVHGRRAGVDLRAAFLLPVYARPRQAPGRDRIVQPEAAGSSRASR